MLSLQILSFGGLLKCGLISEWREEGEEGRDGEGEQNHYPKVSQHFHTAVLTIAQVMIRSHIWQITLDYNGIFFLLLVHINTVTFSSTILHKGPCSQMTFKAPKKLTLKKRSNVLFFNCRGCFDQV